MADDLCPKDGARFRDVAHQLRGIAQELRFDLGRRAQLMALADGFDRFAARVERRHTDERAAAD